MVRDLVGATCIIISDEDADDIMKIRILKEFVLLMQSNSETIKNEGKEQKCGIFGMLLCT